MTDKTRADFEAWAAHQEMDMNRFDIGYSDCNTDYAWLAWQAATLAEQGKRQPLTDGDAKDAGRLVIDVYYSIGNDPFICAVFGETTAVVLSQIEKEFIDNPNECPSFEKGEGTYKYETSFCEGQFDAHGRCELRGYWEHDEIGFTATPPTGVK